MKVTSKNKTVSKSFPIKRKKVIRKKSFFGEARAGALYAVAILGVVAFAGASMSGGIVPAIKRIDTPPPTGPLYTCCDSGDGDQCHPIVEKQITYNGDAYGLLKSNIAQGETAHIAPTNDFTPDGHRIFINTSDHTADYSSIPGCESGKDLIGLDDPTKKWGGCFGVPNEEIIYVCKDTTEACNQQVQTDTTPFDVYFRLKDGAVPKEITTYCPKPSGTVSRSGQQVVGIPTPGDRKNLQLEWFQVKQDQKLTTWLGAWCKPAINLYPTEKTTVTVKVAPKGRFTYTEPSYPEDGWQAIAYPDGRIQYGSITYPYLFWEASLPDNLIPVPTDGYVVSYAELGNLFQTKLPEMGLNEREKKQFSDYWLKALPKANYYFVGVVPQTVVDTLAPLTISPQPDSILRVTVYFKALDQKINVQAPQLTGFERKGFTVTEWGGFFKADKNHQNFTCLM